MAVRVGINGFGRIGRQSLKAIIERAPGLEVVAVNDIVDVPTNALLFAHDSTYGNFDGTVTHTDDSIVINGKAIKVFQLTDPAQLPWKDLGVDIVIESTGKFTEADKARAHITAGARKVLISAPAKGEDVTIVLGVNEGMYDPAKHVIISNASCTTNCLAPVAKVLNDTLRDREGRDDHGPQLHRRPEDPGRCPQGSAPRPLGRPEHDPDDDRRRQGALASSSPSSRARSTASAFASRPRP